MAQAKRNKRDISGWLILNKASSEASESAKRFRVSASRAQKE